MAHKIFVSYKFADDNVYNINGKSSCTVRDYVNELENELSKAHHIYKGESDDEDLSHLSEETIWKKLRDRIYDSSLTIVMISQNMKLPGVPEKNQWIPWEVSYSLKETSRKDEDGYDITGKSNALLAVVIPNVQGEHSYFIENKHCCKTGCRIIYTHRLFKILGSNMFNHKEPNTYICSEGKTMYKGEPSYLISAKWRDFLENAENYIDRAFSLREKIDDYLIQKEI